MSPEPTSHMSQLAGCLWAPSAGLASCPGGGNLSLLLLFRTGPAESFFIKGFCIKGKPPCLRSVPWVACPEATAALGCEVHSPHRGWGSGNLQLGVGGLGPVSAHLRRWQGPCTHSCTSGLQHWLVGYAPQMPRSPKPPSLLSLLPGAENPQQRPQLWAGCMGSSPGSEGRGPGFVWGRAPNVLASVRKGWRGPLAELLGNCVCREPGRVKA